MSEGRPARRAPHSTWLWCALIVLVFCFGQLGSLANRASPDTLQYVTYAHRLLGENEATAARHAGRYYCVSSVRAAARNHFVGQQTFAGPFDWGPALRQCEATQHEQMLRYASPDAVVWSALPPRYQAIFSARPGFPLTLAAFIAVLGDFWGIWLCTTLIAALGGVLCAVVLRRLGAGAPAALAGQVLYYVLPTGGTALRPMSEGLGMALVLLMLDGTVLMLRGRTRVGLAVTVVSAGACFAVRYSLAQEAVLALGGGLALRAAVDVRRRRLVDRSRRTCLAVYAGLAVVVMGASSALGWPGLRDSVQDTVTVHFARPDLANPWPRFLLLEEHFWRAWLADQASSPLLPVCLALAVWGAWRWAERNVGMLLLALGATGVANEAAHPLMEIGERMIITLWLLPVLGVALAIDAITRPTRNSTPGAGPLTASERAPGAAVPAPASG